MDAMKEIREQHEKVDLGCQHLVQGEVCRVCKTKWPCDMVSLLAHADALAEALEGYRESHNHCIENEPQGLCNKCQRARTALVQWRGTT